MRIERVFYGRKVRGLGRWNAVGMRFVKLCEEMLGDIGQKCRLYIGNLNLK